METKLSSSKILIPLDLKTFFAESAPIRGFLIPWWVGHFT